jgi:hypothetical protein
MRDQVAKEPDQKWGLKSLAAFPSRLGLALLIPNPFASAPLWPPPQPGQAWRCATEPPPDNNLQLHPLPCSSIRYLAAPLRQREATTMMINADLLRLRDVRADAAERHRTTTSSSPTSSAAALTRPPSCCLYCCSSPRTNLKLSVLHSPCCSINVFLFTWVGSNQSSTSVLFLNSVNNCHVKT